MWRWRKAASRVDFQIGNKALENQDSDQSISEEEEDGDWAGSAISLGRAGEKGGMQVLSQLEILRDSYELHPTEGESISSQERKGAYLVDDEIENPLFFGGDSSNCSPKIPPAALRHPIEETVYIPTVAPISHVDEELISEDEEISSPILRIARNDVGGTWSEATREVDALICLNENSGHSTTRGAFIKENKLYKGGGDRTKSKPKFIFRSHSRTSDPSWVVSDASGRTSSKNIPQMDGNNAAVADNTDTSVPESKLIIHRKYSNQLEKNVVSLEEGRRHDFREHSVAEFLGCFNDSNDLLQGSLKQGINKRGEREKMVLNSNEPRLGDRNLKDDELPDALDSDDSPICSDDEENPQSLKPILPRRTMVDKFHDAFGMSPAIDERPYLAFPGPSCGIRQKLQKVIKIEKERDMDYLKNTSVESSSSDERTCIYVRILSRSLEAKLIVCSCTSVGDEKKPLKENNLQMRVKDGTATLIIIFNPRVCSDVELEVGNLICIHQPWKEVKAKGRAEAVLLCSYFSRFHPRRNLFKQGTPVGGWGEE